MIKAGPNLRKQGARFGGIPGAASAAPVNPLVFDGDFTLADTLPATISGVSMTFTRASSANRVNSLGFHELVGTGVGRITYNPMTLQNLGYLSEIGATNRILWSRDLTNVAWVKTNITATQNQTGTDNASNSCTLLEATAGNATVLQAVVVSSAIRCTWVMIKRVTGTGIISMTQDNGSTWVDVSSIIDAQAYKVNGYTLVRIPKQTLANPVFGIRISTSGDKIAVDRFNGMTTDFLDSPIDTTTVAVTTANDLYTGALAPGPEVTMYVKCLASVIGAANTILQLDDGTNTNRARFNFSAASIFTGIVAVGGVVQASLGVVTQVEREPVRAAMRVKLNDFGYSLNGAVALTDTSGTVPTISKIIVGCSETVTGQPDGPIAMAKVWSTPFTDAQLQALTA